MSKSEQYIFVLSLIVIDGVTGMIIVSAAERGAIVSFVMMLLIYIVFVLCRVRLETRTKTLTWMVGIITIAVCIASGLVAYLWNNSNRSLNITVNYPIFKQLGNLWTGMGWVDNACFHADTSSFGIKTSSLDLYYVYIFFTTGVIGCALIGGALLLIIVKICTNKKTNINITAMGFVLAWSFLAFWECTMFSYKFISCYMISVIMAVAMFDDCCLEEKNG